MKGQWKELPRFTELLSGLGDSLTESAQRGPLWHFMAYA